MQASEKASFILKDMHSQKTNPIYLMPGAVCTGGQHCYVGGL